MSKRITQPVNQVRLTNVAMVRMKRHGHRFEIACYKNKVVNWRNGVEKDLDEVLQIRNVFSNVSKGVLAKSTEMMQAFGTDDVDKVCQLILEHGELQISDKERKVQYEGLFRDIATIVAEKCVNPETKRPYTVGMIEKAMRNAHFSVQTSQGAKQQALECIAELRKVIPIERAKMRLRLRVAARVGESLKAALHKREAGIESELWGEHYAVTCQLTPGFFREVDHLVRELDPEGGSLEVLDLAVHAEGAETLELEAAAPAEAAPVWRGAEAVAVPSVAAAAAAAAPAGGSGAAGAGAFKCRTCGVAFAERAGHREHYKSEWHRFNLKRGMKELPAVTEDEFMRVDAAAKEAFLREL